MIFKNSQKGVSLYLALIILSLNLSIVLGTAVILIRGMEESQNLGNSIVAFYAAGTGIETVLLDRNNLATSSSSTFTGNLDLNNNSIPSYEVLVVPADGSECTTPNFCLRSIGSYKETKRVIRVNY